MHMTARDQSARIVDIGKDNFGTKCHFIGTEADAIRANASADMLATLQTIADFAVGHGDVCEIIAQRARAAILKAYGE